MWFPSGRTCSACGTINPKLKRERMWTCPSCATRHDRNLNAAINLRNLIMPEGRGRDGPGQEAMGQQGRRLHAGAILARPSFPGNQLCRTCWTGNGTLSRERTSRELRYDQ